MGTIFVDKIKNGAGGATVQVDEIVNVSGDSASGINLSTNDAVAIKIAGSEKARMDSNGHLLVGKTSTGIGTVGAELKATGELLATVSGDACAFLNRTSSDGSIIDFRKDGSTIGQINSINSNLAIGTGDTGLRFIDSSDQIIPVDVAGGSTKDASLDLGQGGTRMAQIFASVGSINTSDQNEKQNIETFTDAEMKVAKRISALFKKYKIKTAVTKKGDSARVHSGVIAQEVESAFKAEGLDASKYSFWCSDTWWEVIEKYTDDDGVEKIRCNTYPTKEEAPSGSIERTRLGIRYEELLSFICAYNEQRFASIEARLTALESK